MLSAEFANEVSRTFSLGKVLGVQALNSHVHRIDTPSGSFVAKLEQLDQLPKDRASADRLLAQHKLWFEAGVPVAEPMAAIDGHFQVVVNGLSLHVNRFLDAVPFHQACFRDRDFIRVAKSLGAGLAKLHGQSWSSSGNVEDSDLVVRQVSDIVTSRENSQLAPLFRQIEEGGPIKQYKALIAGDIHDGNVLVERETNRVVLIDLDTETTRLRNPLDELSSIVDNLDVVCNGSPRAVKAFGAALYESYVEALPIEPGEKGDVVRSLQHAQLDGLVDRFYSDDGQQGRAVAARIHDCVGAAEMSLTQNR